MDSSKAHIIFFPIWLPFNPGHIIPQREWLSASVSAVPSKCTYTEPGRPKTLPDAEPEMPCLIS